MDHILKACGIDLTKSDLAKGRVRAVFATMGVVDKDGDVTLPGFFGKQNVVIVPGHDWSSIPLGKGVTSEEGDKAIIDMELNLELQAAKDWLSHLKFDLAKGEPLQEWSYGFKVLDGGSRVGDFNGRQVRYLQPREDGTPGSKIWEVSPVLVGAGEKTRTLAAKSATGCMDAIEAAMKMCQMCMDDPSMATPEMHSQMMDMMRKAKSECQSMMNDPMKSSGKTFSDEADAVRAAAESLVTRGKALADLRAKEGRDISAANKEKLAAVAASLTKAVQEVATLIVAPSEKPSEAKKELARMLRIRAGIK